MTDRRAPWTQRGVRHDHHVALPVTTMTSAATILLTIVGLALALQRPTTTDDHSGATSPYGSPKRMSSNNNGNNVLNPNRFKPRRPNSGGNAAAVVCEALPTANRKQLDLCARYPDVVVTSMQGLKMAARECRKQFEKNRWNCTTVTEEAPKSSRKLFTSEIMHRGYRESAFLHALTSAGVAHTVARACSLGRLVSCGCGQGALLGTGEAAVERKWRWSGCDHNVEFGLRIAKLLLDAEEKGNNDIRSRINTHNNRVGRDLVSRNVKVRCKCHGMSGSCELKTCWRASANFGRVGAALKERHRQAVLVAHTNNNGHGNVLGLAAASPMASSPPRRRSRSRPLRTELVYLERSPSFCEPDAALSTPGTRGRQCRKGAPESDNCDAMCCGRGYNTLRRRRVERCRCRFRWCCHVECDKCVTDDWVTVCK